MKNYAYSDQDIPSSIATHMLTQFGQFLDHDIAATPENGYPYGPIFTRKLTDRLWFIIQTETIITAVWPFAKLSIFWKLIK